MAAWIPDLYKQLFYEHYAAVVRKIAAITGEPDAAEDLAQEVFLRLYRNPPDDVGKAGAWLHRVLTHVSYDYLRKRVRDRKLLDKQAETLHSAEDSLPSGEQIMQRRLEQDELERLLSGLNERDRQVLVLRSVGYSYAEIAERLQVKKELIGTLVGRAAERFRKLAASQTEEQALDVIALRRRSDR